jgi:hypothetical protein
MASPALEEVIDAVKALSVEEQRRLREVLDSLLLPSSSQPQEEELARVLLQAGLINELKLHGVDAQLYRQYEPIPVVGKPVSETLIEERR